MRQNADCTEYIFFFGGGGGCKPRRRGLRKIGVLERLTSVMLSSRRHHRHHHHHHIHIHPRAPSLPWHRGPTPECRHQRAARGGVNDSPRPVVARDGFVAIAGHDLIEELSSGGFVVTSRLHCDDGDRTACTARRGRVDRSQTTCTRPLKLSSAPANVERLGQ